MCLSVVDAFNLKVEGKGARTELQDVGVDAEARDQAGKAPLQMGHGIQRRVRG